MASGNVSLTLGLTGEDRLSAVISRAEKQMKSFGRGAKKGGNDASKAFASLQMTISGVGTRFTELNSKIALVKQGFQAIKSAGEFAISGEIANNADTIFTQVVGSAENAKIALAQMREASSGIIDDTSLQVFASRLLVSGAQMKEVAGMAALAGRVALATGRDTEQVMTRLQLAILGGRQTEFKRLGVSIELNKVLEEQLRLEGRRVEDLEMGEVITRRLNHVTEVLARAMDAAGINTEELSTNLRGLRADVLNLESAAQQTMADFLTPEKVDEEAKKVEKTIDRMMKRLGVTSLEDVVTLDSEHFKDAFASMSKDLAKLSKQSLDVVESQMKNAALGVEIMGERTLQAFTEAGRREELARNIAEARLSADRKAFEQRHELAKKSMQDEQRMEIEQGQIVVAKREEIAKITAKFAQERLEMSEEEIATTQSFIKTEKILLKVLEKKIDERQADVELLEEAANIQEKLAKIDQKEIDRQNKAKEDQQRKAKSRQEAFARASLASQKNLTKQLEDLEIQAGLRENRRLEIGSAEEIKNAKTTEQKLKVIEKRKNDELAKLAERRILEVERAELAIDRKLEKEKGNTALKEKARSKALSEAILTIRQNQAAEEKRIHEEAFDAQVNVLERRMELDREVSRVQDEALERMRDRQAAQMEETNIFVGRLGDAFAMPLDPLSQMIEMSDGANRGLKALGATMAATSAAANAYANSQSTAKTQTERLVQTTPAMISSGGAAAAAFVKQTKTKALIQGGFEAASSLASLAAQDYVGFVGHAAAATAFFALAGQGGGSSKAPKADRRQTALQSGGALGGGFQKSTAPIVVNVQGFAMGSAADLGTQLGSTIEDAKETGISSNRV